jgi:hypothetical protein
MHASHLAFGATATREESAICPLPRLRVTTDLSLRVVTSEFFDNRGHLLAAEVMHPHAARDSASVETMTCRAQLALVTSRRMRCGWRYSRGH